MKRKIVSIVIALGLLAGVTAIPAAAATTAAIDQATEDGVAWLASQQNTIDGSWGAYTKTAMTGLVLVKLQERAYELGHLSPFDSAYEYSGNVTAGWGYIFNALRTKKQTSLPIQTHGANSDDPDTNGNGYGVYFSGAGQETYTTGICLMALVASGTPGRANDGGLDFDGDGNADTFQELAQEAADWLAYAQSDSGAGEGGWYYLALNNAAGNPDNSNSGYAVLGLAYAKDFGCTVPAWVSTELNAWINAIQDTSGGTDDGGSYYRFTPTFLPWVNQLKTGNLIFQMTFFGDGSGTARFQNALAYIERHWRDANQDPGWRGDIGIDDDGDGNIDEDPLDGVDNDLDGLFDEDRGSPANYQAMYCLMKGLEYSGINLLDTDGDAARDDDWFNQEPPTSPAYDFASVLVAQQNVNGSWPFCVWGDGGLILSTTWALLTLEKVAPPPPEIEVPVDIKPESCPNPLNVNSKGVLPVAILGTADLDVTQIDVSTVTLESVSPIRSAIEDVAAPFGGEIGDPPDRGDCTELGADGYLDLTLKFDKQAIVAALGPVSDGDVLVLELTGELLDGTDIFGADVVWIKKKGKK